MTKRNHLAADLQPLGRFTDQGDVMKLSLAESSMLTSGLCAQALHTACSIH